MKYDWCSDSNCVDGVDGCWMRMTKASVTVSCSALREENSSTARRSTNFHVCTRWW